MPVLEQQETRVHDFVLNEYDQRYTRIAATIRNASGGAAAAGEIGPGTPLTNNGGQWETTDGSSGEAAFDGFYVDSRQCEAIDNAAISVKEYQILVRGPALVNLDAIPDVDANGATIVKATLATAMAAFVPPIIALREPVTQSTDMWE